MSKLIVIPQGTVDNMVKLARKMGTVYLTVPVLRTIATYIDLNEDSKALSYLMIKTQWDNEKAVGYLNTFKDNLKEYLLCRKAIQITNIKKETLEESLNKLNKSISLIQETMRARERVNVGFKFIKNNNVFTFSESEDLDFSYLAEEELSVYYETQKKKLELIAL